MTTPDELRARPVCFVVAHRQQMAIATAVARHLRRPAIFWDVNSQRLLQAEEEAPSYRAPGYRRTARAAWTVRHGGPGTTPPAIVVVGQDVGLLERAVSAAARAAGASVVLVPDGVATTLPLAMRGRFSTAKRFADALLCRAGLLAGGSGRWGASHPDVVCSWGPAWDSVWRDCPSVERSGAPHTDALVLAEPSRSVRRLLLCSQPLRELGVAPSRETLWYELLRVAATQDDVRVRLHPRESGDALASRHPEEDQVAVSSAPLAEDLQWADVVAAPLSTILLDAVAAGRRPVLIGLGLDVERAACPYFADERLPAVPLQATQDVDTTISEIRAAARSAGQADLASDYLSNLGVAASAVAAVLDRAADEATRTERRPGPTHDGRSFSPPGRSQVG